MLLLCSPLVNCINTVNINMAITTTTLTSFNKQPPRNTTILPILHLICDGDVEHTLFPSLGEQTNDGDSDDDSTAASRPPAADWCKARLRRQIGKVAISCLSPEVSLNDDDEPTLCRARQPLQLSQKSFPPPPYFSSFSSSSYSFASSYLLLNCSSSSHVFPNF